MAQLGTPAKNSPPRKIEYLSPPAEVNMADPWFDVATLEHFWIRRRFAVLQKLACELITRTGEMAEVGCGHGLLQRQIEDTYGREVTGFDLNEYALKQNVSQRSKVYCYDILAMDAAFQARFEVIFLFDVLEHILDEEAFLRTIKFYLAPHGKLVVNVPAGQWIYSTYDRAVGHLRRYSIGMLRKAVSSSGLQVERWSYWGLPFIPILMLRKLWLAGKQGNQEIIAGGMDARTEFFDTLLAFLSRCEVTPQKLAGASLMAVLQVSEGRN
jgi:SAM-dependent methyltransferase